jgi:hypothetical protein
MDGRRETVYSQRLFDAHMSLYRGDPAGLTLVADLEPDFVWLPSTTPILKQLRASGWHLVFAGPDSTILSRMTLGPVVEPPAVTAPRCFPEP